MFSKMTQLGFLALLTTTMNGYAATITTTPHSGFQKHLAYVASGYDNCPGGNDSCVVVDGNVVDAFGEPVVGEYFERETMGRSLTELEAHRDAAIAFFVNRFGNDIMTLEAGVNNEDDVWRWVEESITGFTLDPRTGYRAIAISRYVVPTEGYMVRDGGWLITPGGKTAVFGEYSILRERRTVNAFAQTRRDLILHYQSQNLINPNPNPEGPTAFDCELWLGDYDEEEPELRGFAQGMFSARPVPNIRNILTLNDPDRADYPGLGTNNQ